MDQNASLRCGVAGLLSAASSINDLAESVRQSAKRVETLSARILERHCPNLDRSLAEAIEAGSIKIGELSLLPDFGDRHRLTQAAAAVAAGLQAITVALGALDDAVRFTQALSSGIRTQARDFNTINDNATKRKFTVRDDC